MKNGSSQHERSIRGKKSRAEILSKAVEVFSELGPDGATLRLVARRAGVNIATLMYYFPSKENLFTEVVGLMEGGELHIVEFWRDSLTDSRLSQIDSLKGALTELGTMIIDRVIRDPSRFRLGVYSALDTSRPEQVDPAGSSKNPSPEKEVVRSVLTRAVELGTLHCDPQEIEDYIEGYTYLSRGFAIAHIKEIAKGSKKRNVITQRFRKLIYRYINNMLPGEKDEREEWDAERQKP